MGSNITLKAADGVATGAYLAKPEAPPRGGLVVLQEIFGINAHIRDVTDRFAAQGYLAIAPALFDRVKPGLELDYDEDGIKIGRATMAQTERAAVMKDIQAAIDHVVPAGKVGIVGYCWGGTLAFAAACELTGLAAAVGYYGGGIATMLDRKPAVPVMLHFGETDASIPLADVEKVRAAFPDMPVYTYPAGHGFNCDRRASYDRDSADLALSRTLPFLRDHVG